MRAGLQGTTGTEGGSFLLPGPMNWRRGSIRRSCLFRIFTGMKKTPSALICAPGDPVLLIGSSMVGKTKMAARVIAEEFSSWPVAIPDRKTALADLDAKDVTLRDSVIWLDDIDRLIGVGGITDGALRRLAAAGNIIIGTVRAEAYERVPALRPAEACGMGCAERVRACLHQPGPDPKEQERLAPPSMTGRSGTGYALSGWASMSGPLGRSARR